MVRFFIDRPIFATVLSVLITLAGALAVGTLPVSQYPPVTPPTIQVDCNYPGAGRQTVSETIAAPIEQQVNGVEDMMYMSSQSTSDGTYTLTVTFKTGTDLNLAQVLVLNRVSLAMPNLPDVVRATGVTTRKRSPELLMTFALSSPDGRYDQVYLSNYAVLRLKDALQRVKGVSDCTIFGQKDYSMRVWLDPQKLAARGLSAVDVVAALREQNAQVAGGQVGQPPTDAGQLFQLTIDTVGRLEEVEQFENVVLKANAAGAVVRLRDVAAVELGAKSQDVANRFDRKPTVGLAIFLLPDANSLEVADTLMGMMAEAGTEFPEGMVWEVGYDTSPFVRESIHEVFKSLRDAILLVAVVVMVFLQSWRAAIIPLAAVPVAIVGTFAAMWAVGFTVNNLTLFGLVLAVGIVVDDAIVIVEAVQHHIEQGLAPRAATIQAMSEVTGPVVAVGVVLAAVFVPCTFLSGIVGQFFRQFALTIAISTLISALDSLTLSPALCALLLKPTHGRQDLLTRLTNLLFGRFFRLFNRGFDRAGRAYVWSVGKLIRLPALVLVVYAGLLAMGYELVRTLPTGFIPSQDKGYLIASIQLPDAASAERTQEAIDKIAKVVLTEPGVVHTNAVAGNSFVLSAYGSNFGSMFIILDQFDRRRTPDLYADAIAGRLRGKVAAAVPDAQVSIFGAPAVSGLGRAGGFRVMIEDRAAGGGGGARGDADFRLLQGQTENLIEQANQQRQLVGLFTSYKARSPQVFLEVDRTACRTHGLELRDVYGVLQGTMGQRYANDFNKFGRVWQVNVQADPKFRNELEDVKRIKVRNRYGEMVPLGTVLTAKEVGGPQVVTRYNMYPSAVVNGNVAPGVSSGDAMAVFERVAERELPPGRMAAEWTELMYIEKASRNTGLGAFAVAVIAAFLVLAALYESWATPLAVILVVPVCVVASLMAVWATDPGSAAQSLKAWQVTPELWGGFGAKLFAAADWLDAGPVAAVGRWTAAAGVGKQDVNIFTQVGFVVLIGLACKNAILIVEFASVKRREGADRYEAVLAACRLRFRPILMTSFAFILGVLPLVIGTGAGAEMRRALGIAVFGGMLGVTVFGIFMTPVFFVLVDRLTTAAAVAIPRPVQAWSNTILYVLGLGFVPPLARGAVDAARAATRVVTRPRTKA